MRLLGPIALVLLAAAASPKKNIEWQKDYASAQKLSDSTGKPMVLVFCVGSKGGGCCGGAGGLAQRFSDLGDDLNTDDFLWVLVGDQKIAQQFNAVAPGVMVVCDPEGAELRRGTVCRTSTMVELLQDAQRAYQGPLDWQVSLPDSREKAIAQSKLMLVFFEDGKQNSKKTLDAVASRMVAVHRKRLVYLRLPFAKDSKEVAEFKVIQAPQIVIYDPKQSKDDKKIVSTAIGTRTDSQLRTFLDGVFRNKLPSEPAKELPHQETPRK
jgi:hypothetical protein